MKRTIEASAGTGKTYELTTIVASALAGRSLIAPDDAGSGLILTPEFERLLDDGVLRTSQILLVTFTEAATSELRARVRGRLMALWRDTSAHRSGSAEAARLDEALRDIDAMTISTIHGFCARMTQEHAFELGLPCTRLEIIDEEDLARELVMRWWSERIRDDAVRERMLADAGIGFERLVEIAIASLGSRGVALACITSDGVDGLLDDLMRCVRRDADAALRERGRMTYQDQLVTMLEGVRRSPALLEAIRERYRLAVIDEAQDNDPVQIEIFERIFDAPGDRRRMLVLVGDPKQSIYAFRGADLDAYLRLRGDQPILRLSTNRRSEPAVVDAVNRLFGGECPFRRAGIEHPPVESEANPRHGRLIGAAPFEVRFGDAGLTPEQWTVAVVRAMRANARIEFEGTTRPLRWSDCAVLGPSNDKIAGLDRVLRAAGLPTVLLGDRSVFSSAAVGELRALLAACAEPGRGTRVRRAMISLLVGVPPAVLAQDGAEAIVGRWSERFGAWAEASRRAGILGIVERALQESPVAVETRLATDALHLAELVHEDVGSGATAAAMLAALDRLTARFAGERTRPGDRRRVRIDQSDAITLQTLHRSKGLEYGVVLLPWAGASATVGREPCTLRVPAERLPELGTGVVAPEGVAPGESVVALVPHGSSPPIIEERALEEAIRELYVGVTRPRHALRAFVARASVRSGGSAIESLGVSEHSNPWPPREAPAIDGGEAVALGEASSPARRPRADSEAVGRELALWFDTSFTRLSASSSDAEPEQLTATVHSMERDDEPAPVVSKQELRGGPELGRIMHRIFEWAATTGHGADMRPLAARAIDESGASGRFDALPLASLAERVRASDLSTSGGPATTLAAIDPRHLAVEVPFCVPLGHAVAATPNAIGQVCALAPSNSPVARFASLARALRFGRITGFLRGTIDLVFRHEQAWWIVDYKTNHLGDRDDAYRPEALAGAMVRHHYVLQYLLYTVALRRVLAARGVDVGGDSRWLGGVIYPFVRGVDPNEPGRGIFVDRPSDRVIDALDGLVSVERHAASEASAR